MATIKISALTTGTPKGTDETPAVDTTDTTQASSGTTKKYIRSSELNYYLHAQGLTTYTAVLAASTGALTATYANGALGVGATLTNAGAQAALTLDGVTLAVSDRVLIKNQAAPAQNGIYTVTTVGTASTNWVLTRATDYDQAAEIIQYGVVLVNQGTISAGLLYQETGAGPWTIGTTAITFALYAAGSGSSVNIGTANQTAYYATAGSVVSGVGPGSTGQLYQSNGSGSAPAFTTATYPSVATGTGTILRANGTNWVASTSTFADTYAVSTLLYANSSNAVSGLATTNRAALSTNATGVPTWLALTDGQLVVGSTAGSPAAASLTAGTGVSITNASNAITINVTGGGLATATISGTTQTAAVNTTYIALNAGQTTLTLPAVYAVGDIVRLVGATANTGGWVVTASTGDTIRVNNSTTSAGGTVTSTAAAGQCIELICDVANTSWVMTSTASVLLTTA